MMRDLFLITLISFAVGTDFSPHQNAENVPWEELFPVTNEFLKQPVFGGDRRRPQGSISDECYKDIQIYYVWCTRDPNFNCDWYLWGEHTKWVIQVDHDTEWMCYPSSCSGNDLQYIYSNEIEMLNSSARYCTLECPAIRFDISGVSEDGESMSISGMYNYADLSYDCAGAAAMTEISTCEETGACPSSANGVTTCTITYEDRNTYAHINRTWKRIGQICLPDECTDDANLEKLQDFHYAYLGYRQELKNNVYLTAAEIRDGYLVEYACPDDSGDRNEDDESSEGKDTSSHKYSKYILISGIISAVLFILCFGAICILRVRRGGVVMTPIIAVEFNNRETVAVERPSSERNFSQQRDRVETGIVEVEPRASPVDYARPIQTNEGFQSGERD